MCLGTSARPVENCRPGFSVDPNLKYDFSAIVHLIWSASRPSVRPLNAHPVCRLEGPSTKLIIFRAKEVLDGLPGNQLYLLHV